MVRARRRTFVEGAGALALLALLPAPVLARLRAEAAAPGAPGRFLTARELDTLRALTARLVPGPPGADPGEPEAGAAEGIDLLLGAFALDPPVLHAGGPFSDRAGARHDDFADFVALEPHAELGWRIRIEAPAGAGRRPGGGRRTARQHRSGPGGDRALRRGARHPHPHRRLPAAATRARSSYANCGPMTSNPNFAAIALAAAGS